MKKTKQAKTLRRARRVRARIHGTAARPRLTVFRSAKSFSAQAIDDVTRRTLVAVTSRGQNLAGKPVEVAGLLGAQFAQRAQAAGITTVVFDRGRYAYHGRVQAFAEAARAGGLIF